MADTTNFGFRFRMGKKSAIASALAAGVLKAGDFILTSDTHENVFINSDNTLITIRAHAPNEIWESIEAAESFLITSEAFAGQTLKVLKDGKYQTFLVQSQEDGSLVLEKEGTEVKQYVYVVEALPESEQEQGVIYINTTDKKGYVWLGTEWRVIFEDMSWVQSELDTKAPINNPTFTGAVTLATDPSNDLEAATKQYVDRLIDGLVSSAPGVVDSSNPLPASGYKAGQTWRVAEAGSYAGHVCEAGDLIICVKNHESNAVVSEGDFMVVQANVSGAVTGSEGSTDSNLVIFDGITGKKIKDSGITLEQLQRVIDLAHSHSNKEILDTFELTQAEFLSEMDSKITSVVGAIPDGVTVKQYVDNVVQSGGSDVASEIAKAKNEAIITSNEYTDNALAFKVY